jgi:hypothetical protein
MGLLVKDILVTVVPRSFFQSLDFETYRGNISPALIGLIKQSLINPIRAGGHFAEQLIR